MVWLKQKISARLGRDRNRDLFRKYAKASMRHKGTYHSQKVLLMRLDLIGDCTMFTGAARRIRELYADREITVLCLKTTKPIFENLGIFDRIICMDFKPNDVQYDKLHLLISQLRKDEYDILLQPQTSRLPVADILAASVKCNRRIAMESKISEAFDAWTKMAAELYDELIPYPRGNVSEFDYYGAFVRGLGDKDYKTTCPSLSYGKQNFVSGKYYVLYPGGSFQQKFWAPDRFAKLAGHIYQKTGYTGVILGVASEQWVSDLVKKELDVITSMAVVDLTGKTSIPDVIDIIGNAQLVVSNDTSGVHIACATQTPSVAIAGGWHFKRFLPYHIEDVKPGDQLPLVAYTEMPCYHCDWDWNVIGPRNAKCLQRMQEEKTSECIDLVTYEQVRDLVDKVIDG